MSETGSPDTQEQAYVSVNRLQRYFISMTLLSASIGLNIGMVIGNPSRLMLIVGGFGVSISGFIMLYTESYYSDIDAVLTGKDDSDSGFWYSLLHRG